MINRFYLFLWLRWSLRLTICSVVLATGFSFIIVSFIYINLGMPTLHTENFIALFELFKFWFPISWSLAILVAMFRGVKYLFNNCYGGYMLKLSTCNSLELLKEIGYGDLVKVWRRWIMMIIWLVGLQMIFALTYTILFTNLNSVFEWFNIYWLFAFTLIAGYISIILLASRCKQVKLATC